MRFRAATGAGVAVATIAALAAVPARADETTIGYGPQRSAWDSAEPALTPAAVRAAGFGTLWATVLPRPAGQDATSFPNQIYAQPIVADGYVVVATEENQVDALDPRTGAVDWTTSLGPPDTPAGCGDLVPHVGITSTPVYDPTGKSVYLVTKTQDQNGPHLRLHSLDVTTGAERAGWPVTIGGTASNSGETLDPATSNQRPGLLLMDGQVYVATASYCDQGPYVGYVAAVNTSTRAVHLWSDEVSGTSSGAGIWQGGGAPMSDGSGRIFVATGNGVSPAISPGTSPPGYLAESVVRLGVNADGSLTAKDFFSPANNQNLDRNDLDLGSGAPSALPDDYGSTAHPHLLAIAGKDGTMRLLDRDHLGGMGQGPSGGDDVVSSLSLGSGVWGRAAVFDGAAQHLIYVLPSNSSLRAVQVAPDGAGVPTLSQVAASAASYGYTSGSPVVTSAGSDPASALVWIVTVSGSAGTNAMLHAYPAIPPATGAWQPVFDASLGTAAKFVAPATDGGRVFVGTRDGRVLAFGAPTSAAVAAPATTDFGMVDIGSTGAATITLTAQRAVTIDTVTTSGAPFAVASSAQTSATLAAGQTLDVPLDFSPTTAGAASGTLTVTADSGAGTERYPFTLSGIGVTPGTAVTPDTLDFGNVPVGQSRQLSFTVRDTGRENRTIKAVDVSPGAYTVSGVPAGGAVITPTQPLSITVGFSPTDAGPSAASVTVDSDVDSHSVALTGTGQTGPPKLALSPATLDFGNVSPTGGRATLRFTVRNIGTSTLAITKAAPPSAPFTVARPLAEGQQLSPGDSITISVDYAPTTGRASRDQYLISGTDGKHAVAVRGNTAPWTAPIRTAAGCLAPTGLRAGAALTVTACTAAGKFTRVGAALHIGTAQSRWCVSSGSGRAAEASPCADVATQRWTWGRADHLRSAARPTCMQGRRGASARLVACRDERDQRWDLSDLFAARGLVSAGSAARNQVCLTLAPDGRARLAVCRRTANQVAVLTDGVIRIRGNCLDGRAPVHLAVCELAQSQLWTIDGAHRIRNATGLCLTDPRGDIASGTQLVLAQCGRANSQVWSTP